MLLLLELFWARIWAAEGWWWFLLGVELIRLGLELIEELFCEAATEAADEVLLLMLFELLLLSVDSTVEDWFDSELLSSGFARTAVGFTTG